LAGAATPVIRHQARGVDYVIGASYSPSALRGVRLLIVGIVSVVALGSAAAHGLGSVGSSELVFISSGTVTFADASHPGELKLALPDYVAEVSPSPDGSLLAYETFDPKISFGLAVAGRSGRVRWKLPNVLVFDPPQWAPDGARFAFSVDGQLWLGGADRRDLRRVARDYKNGGGFAWSPDGRRLVYSTSRGLSLFDRASGRRMPLVHAPGGSGPVWSPTGGVIAYVRRGRLYLTAAREQSPPRLLLPRGRGSPVWDLAWSPDGRRLAGLQGDSLFVVSPTGRQRSRLVAQDVLDLNWSPDSLRLVFSRRAPVQPSLFVAAAAGGVPRRLTLPGDPNKDRHPIWSPDGKLIAFARTAHGFSRVYVVRPDGRGARPVVQDDVGSTACDCGLAWTRPSVSLPSPEPLVTLRPRSEISSGSDVAALSVDGNRAAAFLNYGVGDFWFAWESMFWSPLSNQQTGADVRCFDSNGNVTSDFLSAPALAGDRYAYVCSQDLGDTWLYAATTEQPQPEAPLLDVDSGTDVTVAGAGELLVAGVGDDLTRIEPDGGLTPLRHYFAPIRVLDVNDGRALVEVGKDALEVVTGDGHLVSALPAIPRDGGVVLRGSQLYSLSDGLLAIRDLNGTIELQRRIPADAGLEDAHDNLVLYGEGWRLHLLRLDDGRDIALHIPGQLSFAWARFDTDGAMVAAYNTADRRPGTLTYTSPDELTQLFAAS
jgi:Tol biopolymer transport system component